MVVRPRTPKARARELPAAVETARRGRVDVGFDLETGGAKIKVRDLIPHDCLLPLLLDFFKYLHVAPTTVVAKNLL